METVGSYYSRSFRLYEALEDSGSSKKSMPGERRSSRKRVELDDSLLTLLAVKLCRQRVSKSVNDWRQGVVKNLGRVP